MDSSTGPVSVAKMPDGMSPGQLTSLQIKEMMANAQRMIEERKRALEKLGPTGAVLPPPGVVVPPPVMLATPQLSTPVPSAAMAEQEYSAPVFDGDKKRKLAELQAQIQSKIGALKQKGDVAAPPTEDGQSKPVPLLLDNEGRAIDMTGKQLLFPQHQPTLKANIRAQKRAELKQQDRKLTEEPVANKYFDERLAPTNVLKKGLDRKKKALKFNEPGKFVQLAHKQRMQAQLQKLQQEIAEKARKTGISTAARLAKLSGVTGPSEKLKEYIPQVEWWDSIILDEKDNKKELLTYEFPVKEDAVTNLIEHPTQLRCPTDPHEPVFMPVFLTKKERKKLRRQNRRETWKDKQERIRLGLDAAPAAKVRISNLMRVLGVEAVQDPTKVEAHVRKQMAHRLKTHQEANASRKLTPEQRKEKKLKKLEEDVSLGVQVSVYRIDCLANQSKRFKVDTVAKQLLMTGAVVMYKECNVVIVEGGPKQQKKYRRLILSRIKWEEDMVKDKEDVPNKCVLVWEGMTKERRFGDFKFKALKTEEMVREYFKKHNVQQYWDLAISGTVLETVGEVI
ncbi:unnamed protein product [Orchesella dallaii]